MKRLKKNNTSQSLLGQAGAYTEHTVKAAVALLIPEGFDNEEQT